MSFYQPFLILYYSNTLQASTTPLTTDRNLNEASAGLNLEQAADLYTQQASQTGLSPCQIDSDPHIDKSLIENNAHLSESRAMKMIRSASTYYSGNSRRQIFQGIKEIGEIDGSSVPSLVAHDKQLLKSS